VARQVTYQWESAWEKNCKTGLASKGKAGRKSKLTAVQTQKVVDALIAGLVSRGYKTNLWTLPRVAALITELTGVQYHPGHVWRLLGDNGLSSQRLERREIERDEPKIRHCEAGREAGEKKAGREGRTLVFIDESGLSTRPTRVRTWALCGQTPVIQETFGWMSFCMIGGLALYRF